MKQLEYNEVTRVWWSNYNPLKQLEYNEATSQMKQLQSNDATGV